MNQQTLSMIDPKIIQQDAEESLDYLINIRRQIHQFPELAFEEFKTSALVIEELKKLKHIKVKTVAKTGVLGILEVNPDFPYIGLRADMDALPIKELNKVSYVSQNEGKMHACGHDAHTSALLGAAKIICKHKDKLHHNILFIFQPSEEKLPGGAKVILEEGALKAFNIKTIFGQHVYPELPPGKIGVKAEKYMASADEIYIDIIGKGGHAALPHYLCDPIPIAAEVILSLQQVISRSSDPVIPSVLSFGRIIAEGETNIIPEKVRIEGTFRTFDEVWRKKAHQIIHDKIHYICKANGATADIDIQVGYPFVYNNPDITAKFNDFAKKYLGDSNVEKLELRMTAEDFAFYAQEYPSCFYRFGTGHPGAKLHRPDFDIEENSLSTAAGLMAWIAMQKY